MLCSKKNLKVVNYLKQKFCTDFCSSSVWENKLGGTKRHVDSGWLWLIYDAPTSSNKGINVPVDNYKLKDPTAWTINDCYICARGHADIWFPTNFYFLQPAYKHITKIFGSVLQKLRVYGLFSYVVMVKNLEPL